MQAILMSLDIFSGLAELDWGKVILFATIFAFVVAIVRTCIYVDKKYLSDEKEQKKSKKGKK